MTLNGGDPRVQELLVDVAILKTRLDEANKALERQTVEYERRLGELNNTHDRADKVLRTYVSREAFDLKMSELDTWKNTVNAFIHQNQGRNTGIEKGWGWIVSAVTLAAVVAGAIAAWVFKSGV